jgi:hypothetical protein
MRAVLLLCDYAAAVQGKLYITGGGWNTHNRPGQMLIGLGLHVVADWNDTNRPIELAIRLVDQDGQPVTQSGHAVEIRGKMEFGRPAGLPPGSELSAVAAFNLGLALAAGAYRWEMDLDNERAATESFRVIQPPPRPNQQVG